MLDKAGGDDTSARIAVARSRLANINRFAPLTDSGFAIIVLCQISSDVRKLGNDVAHKYPKTKDNFNVLKGVMEGLVNRSIERKGMCEIMDFLVGK